MVGYGVVAQHIPELKTTMAQTVVQINFRLHMPADEFVLAVAPLAIAVADMPGLHWKTWLYNPENHEVSGICLFTDQTAAEAYLNGPLLDKLKNGPTTSDLRVTKFEVLKTLTAITRGPL